MSHSKIVEVVPYNAAWPEIFKEEAARVKQALGSNCIDVLHVGSTSIPGISAKPIIDMLPVVQDILAVTPESLQEIGYRWRGDMGMMFRRFCQKYESDKSFHLHIWETGHSEIDKHRLFREYLIQNPAAFKGYEDLKLALAHAHKDDRMTYTLSKDDFIKNILDLAGHSGKLIVQALTPAEWSAYHRIRKEQIFDGIGLIYDPQHPTITAPDHYHFVMSIGTKIVGVAQVQLLDETRAALRPFAIDAPYQNQGLGTWFLKQIERWVSHQNRTLIQLHADPKALNFYKRAGYKTMPFPEEQMHTGCIDMGKFLST